MEINIKKGSTAIKEIDTRFFMSKTILIQTTHVLKNAVLIGRLRNGKVTLTIRLNKYVTIVNINSVNIIWIEFDKKKTGNTKVKIKSVIDSPTLKTNITPVGLVGFKWA